MGSDMAMEARNWSPRPNIIEWDGDNLVVKKDSPYSGYSVVWNGRVNLENSVEVSLFKQAFGAIPTKPEPVIPTYTRLVAALRLNFDYHNEYAVRDIWEIIEDVAESGIKG